MGVVNSASLTALRAGFSRLFQAGVAQAKMQWNKVAMRMPSRSKKSVYGWLGQFPAMAAWTAGSPRPTGSVAEDAYELANDLFANDVTINRADIEDDELGMYEPLMRLCGASSEAHVDEGTFKLLKNGRVGLCYDGKAFFATDHPRYANVDKTGANTPTSNIINAAVTSETEWYVLCDLMGLCPLIYQERTKPEFQSVVDPSNSEVYDKDQFRYGARARRAFGYGHWQQAVSCRDKLTPDNLSLAISTVMEMKWHGGRPMGLVPTHLVVPPKLRARALAVAQAGVVMDTLTVRNEADNDNVGAAGAAVTNINQGVLEVVISPWLA